MATTNRATQGKRNREINKREKQQEKAEKKAFRKDNKTDRQEQLANGIDPDLAGIVAGPQPLPDYED